MSERSRTPSSWGSLQGGGSPHSLSPGLWTAQSAHPSVRGHSRDAHCRATHGHGDRPGNSINKYMARWQTVKDHVAFLTKTEKESTAQYRPSRPIRIEAVHAHGLERHRALGGGPANFLKALPALQGAWSLSPGQFCPMEPRRPQTTGKAARCPCFPRWRFPPDFLSRISSSYCLSETPFPPACLLSG